ncbi:MAG TPA: beta-ketoacyl synthase N-terminal-like domain-containing protein [Micromonosporaceae bacterium]|jgi:3-oxoacyl-[acyl-carrier-protein] synthase II|nr:beta-ketoacyl synthase N-terminal-like domain-containing protein [Micromonosporaceae bacterium]
MTATVSGVGVVRPLEPDGEHGRAPTAGWFDYRRELGARGYKYVPPAFQYLLAAARRAMADAMGCGDGFPAEARGVVVGTNSAVSALHAAMDRTVVASSAAELSPMVAPYFSVNLGGGRLAAEHSFKGFHATLTTPRVAGLEAIAVAARALALGRARWLLVGATEEALDPGDPAVRASESGAVALVVRRGDGGPGHCRVRTRFIPPGTAAATARAVVAAALADVVAGYGDPPIVAVLDGSPVGRAVAAALDERGRVKVMPAGAGCLEPLAQVAAALVGAAEPTVVVTAAAEGNVAVALVTPQGAEN